MAQPRPWVNEVVDALRELGGQGHLNDIYRRVQLRGVMNFAANRNWEARIRGTIETHSSNSEAYVPRNPDYFESVFGLGEGYWRLRQRA